MFEDSLIESGGRLKTKRGTTTAISFILQALLVGVLVLIPLIFTDFLMLSCLCSCFVFVFKYLVISGCKTSAFE